MEIFTSITWRYCPIIFSSGFGARPGASETRNFKWSAFFAIFFAAAGDASASGKDWIESLSAGLDRIGEVGGADPGDRTMIDALTPALDQLRNGLDSAAQAAREGANYTATISRAKAGRASYISEDKILGHNDPGAEAVARLLEKLSGARTAADA